MYLADQTSFIESHSCIGYNRKTRWLVNYHVEMSLHGFRLVLIKVCTIKKQLKYNYMYNAEQRHLNIPDMQGKQMRTISKATAPTGRQLPFTALQSLAECFWSPSSSQSETPIVMHSLLPRPRLQRHLEIEFGSTTLCNFSFLSASDRVYNHVLSCPSRKCPTPTNKKFAGGAYLHVTNYYL